MPPKNKKQRVTATITNDLHTAISSTKPSLLFPANLPSDLLSRAYGLAKPLQDQPGGEHLHRDCSNIWANSSNGQAEAGSSKNGAGKVKSSEEGGETEVLVLDSADEDEEPVQSKRKGKGKAKAKDEELKPKPCSSANCDRNPRCLNWLGQDKWEDDGALLIYFPLSSTVLTALQLQNKRSRTSARHRDSVSTLQTTASRAFLLGCRCVQPSSHSSLAANLFRPQNLGATCYANSFLQVRFFFLL
jgi:hypothetical protein